MSIRPDSIEVTEVVWATPDEGLERVRHRLESPTVRNKWRAHVLVCSDDDQYAVVPVSELRAIVWREGPSALDRSLQYEDLLQFQPGVEQDALDTEEAVLLADQYGGWLVVLQNGLFAGLVMGTNGSQGVSPQPPDTFDLFDELVPDSALSAVDFVEARPQSTVAQVAMDLRALPNQKGACIIVREEDGSFRVITSEELDQRVMQASGDLWGLPLRELVAYLPPAESRERSTLGLQQAQELANRENILVLTDQGRPAGILLSQVVRRDARQVSKPHDALEDSIYTLFTVPEQILRDYPAEAGPRAEQRFVNIWVEDPNQRVLEADQALVAGQGYSLALDVGRLQEQSIVGWDRVPSGPQAIVEPQERETYLYVSLFSQDFAIPEPTLAVRLPQEGDTAPVRFGVTPLRQSWGPDLSRIEVCLYYRTYLVQTFEVVLEVVSAGETARSSQPQVAQLTHARTTSFPDMEKLPPHEMSLTITRDGADRYRFSFLVDPNGDEEAAARAVEMSCSVRLTRDDLSHLITKARRQLLNVMQAFDMLEDRDLEIYRRATRALAQVGRQLYLRLFENSAAQALTEWIETSLPDDSTIQIVDLAGDFVFPWSLIYSVPPWDDEIEIDVHKFWGWRYKLVIMTSALLDTYGQAPEEISTAEPLRVSVGMYERLVGAAEEKKFFDELGARAKNRIQTEILTSRRDMNDALAAADRDLYYFFCHGYTERIATDIQLDADLVSHYARLASNTRDEALREHLDDLFDVSDSWMRLTQGKIPLTQLKEVVPAQFSRYPVVFLNMCESAQVLPSLSDGFVPFFLQRGARAVIGTECSMNTIFADDFARAFLTRFFQGETVGDILLALRRHHLDQGNPLALAYTLYCDADLRLSEPLLLKAQFMDRPETEMAPDRQSRQDAVDVLWGDDLDGLMLTLAARAQAGEKGTAQQELQMWRPPEEAFATDMEAGPEWAEKMVAMGQMWWDRFEPQIYDLLCNRNNMQHYELMEALKDGVKVLAAALAPALVAQFATLPAVAIVLATIVAKKVADASLQAMCDLWGDSLLAEDMDVLGMEPSMPSLAGGLEPD